MTVTVTVILGSVLADEINLGKTAMFWGLIARVKELKYNGEGEGKKGEGEEGSGKSV